MRQYIPIEAENLAQNIDLRPYVYDEIQAASNGQLTDFSPHSPIVAIVEGMDFSIRELRYALNRYAPMVALNHLKNAGIQRSLGNKAIVPLTFTLTAPLSTPFVLSAGYLVSTSNRLEFLTVANLIIPPGSISGIVTGEAVASGSQFNVASGSIQKLSQSRAFLKSVTNLEPATGGADEETIAQTISRGFAALRYRETLITADDFEQEAMRQLGVGSVAKAIGGLASDKVSSERGAVHLFVLNADGTVPNLAQRTALHQVMQPNLPIASLLHISEINLLPVRIRSIASLLPGDNAQLRANEINLQLREYLKPGNFPLGSTLILKEVENVIRQCGVQYIQSVCLESPSGLSYADLPMPSKWTIPIVEANMMTLVDGQADNQFEFVL